MTHLRPHAALALAAVLLVSPTTTAALGPTFGAVPSKPYMGFDAKQAYRDGDKHLAAGEYHLAKQDFQRVLTAVRGQPDAMLKLGQAEAGLGDFRGAASQYQAALRAVPTWITPARELAIADARIGRRDQAKALLDKLQQRAAACSGCSEADALAAAIKAIDAALANPPPG